MIKRYQIIVLTLFFGCFGYDALAFDNKTNASFISEVKTGITSHDVGVFGRKKKMDLIQVSKFFLEKLIIIYYGWVLQDHI